MDYNGKNNSIDYVAKNCEYNTPADDKRIRLSNVAKNENKIKNFESNTSTLVPTKISSEKVNSIFFVYF